MEQRYLPRGGNRQADSFANRFREVMILVDKTQADLARETGINKGSISRYLSGQCEPNARHLYLLANALNVNEWWLLCGDVRNMRFTEQTEKKDDNDRLAE
jgi:transcriptional regulator with XRE-family HTH domain